MPDYLVTMGERMAAFVKRWLADEVKPAPDLYAELEDCRETAQKAVDLLRKTGAL